MQINFFSMRKILITICFVCYFFGMSFSQLDTLSKTKLNLYVDCPFCENAYLRKELTMVNHVRDYKYADIHVLGISQTIGSGGNLYRLIFSGQGRFANMTDTLTFATTKDATEEEIRLMYLKKIKLGLFPYLIKTDMADCIDYSIAASDTSIKNTDPWNGWVTSVSSSLWFNGEKTYKSLNSYSDISIYKVLKEWKTSFYFSQNYSDEKYDLVTTDYDYHFRSINRSLYFSQDYILSVSDHWSAGLFASANTSTFSNIRFSASISPALEYDIYPYEKSFSKQIRIAYRIGPDYNAYIDTTVYDKLSETLWSQNLSVATGFVQKWGRFNFSAGINEYLNDLRKFSFNTSIYSTVRIAKGLEFRVNGGYNMIRNQMFLPKGDVTQEELLLRQRQLETQYSFWGSLGLTYTFGSIYNNVVNPRFGG